MNKKNNHKKIRLYSTSEMENKEQYYLEKTHVWVKWVTLMLNEKTFKELLQLSVLTLTELSGTTTTREFKDSNRNE